MSEHDMIAVKGGGHIARLDNGNIGKSESWSFR